MLDESRRAPNLRAGGLDDAATTGNTTHKQKRADQASGSAQVSAFDPGFPKPKTPAQAGVFFTARQAPRDQRSRLLCFSL
jgi:hypothetical protein